MSLNFQVLGDLVSISKGKKHLPHDSGKNRYINIENLHNPENSLFTNESGVYVEENDLIIAWDGANAGKVGIGFKGVIGSTLARLKLKSSSIFPRYLFWYLESKNSLIKSQRTGATIPHVNGNALKETQIPLPPLATQKRIAEILDAADALRCKDQELLKKYDELAQAIFIDMFGDIMINNLHFDVVKFGSVCNELFLGLTSKVEYVNEGGFPLVRATDINRGILSFENIKYISEEQHRKVTARRITKRGDVLISKSGSLGTCALVDTDNEFSTYESIFTVRTYPQKLDNIFLISLIRNPSFQEKLIGGKVGAGVAHLNLNMLRDFEFPLPPMNLQIRYSITSQNIDNQINKTKLNRDFSEKLFQNLIQKAFKGELVA